MPSRGFWAVLLLSGVLFLATAAYSSVSGDAWTANVASWQIATTGSPWLDTVHTPALDANPLRDVWVRQLPSGHEVIGRSPGAVIAGLPAYALAGSGTFSLVPGAVTAAVIATVSVTLVFATLRQHLAERDAGLAALIFGLSTPMWSVAANGIWPHTITVLGVCGMAWASSRNKWWLVGLFGGIALWGRLHVAVIVAVVGLLVGWRRRDPAVTMQVSLVSGLFLALQCVWTRWMYESWNPMSSYDTDPFENFLSEHGIDLINHLGLWVSPGRGMLIWTPLILVLLPAVIGSWRRLPDWSTALVWGGLAYTILQGTLNRFSGGDTFYGYRLTLELLACLAPAFALSAVNLGRIAGALFPYVLALQTAAIAAGVTNEQFGTTTDRVWQEHSLATPLGSMPLVGLSLVTVCLLVGYLAERIWADPTIKPKKRSEAAAAPDR